MDQHRVPHDLSHELARAATKKALDTYKARFSEYKPAGQWLDDDRARVQFTVAGKTLEGLVQVADRYIGLELDVPFIFRPFRKIAMNVIEEEINEWIGRAKKGELG